MTYVETYGHMTDRLRHMILKGHGYNPNIFGAHYLDDGWRYRLGCNGAPKK